MMGKVQYWWCMLGLKYPLAQYLKKSNLQPDEICLWMKTNGVSLALNLRWAFQPIHFLKDFFLGGVDHFQSLSWMCCNIASVYGLVSGLWAMWDLSPLTGERTCSPGLGWWRLPHWSSGEVPSHPFLSAPSCTDIPNILRLCVFLMPPPRPNAHKDGFLFSSLCANVYKSREGRGTEWRLHGCKLAEQSLQEQKPDLHAPYCYVGRNPLCRWTRCRLLIPCTNWQSTNMQSFASIWERGKDTFLRPR